VHETDAAESGSSGFAGSLDVAPGKQLTVAPRDPKPYGHYDVLAGHDRVGALVLGGSDALARMICADGDWCLQKRRRLGWELLIESREGQHLGWYSGRKWLRGGTISLIDAAHFDLRRSLNRRWTLRAIDRQLTVGTRSWTYAHRESRLHSGWLSQSGLVLADLRKAVSW
jgi:hypothetical protein